jgi:hypothetical protein
MRFRRTKAQIDAIRTAIYDIVEADRPMTVRQVFYQCVVRSLIEKTEAEYDGTVGRLLREMRLNGELPYEWIVDESRRRRVTQTYANPAEALDDCARYYRRSALAECDDYVEIWCEKDALAALLYEVTSDYDVPLLVSRGMPSLSILHGTALEIMAADRDGKQTYIYQFGDWDPTGVIIPKAIEKRLDEMAHKKKQKTQAPFRGKVSGPGRDLVQLRSEFNGLATLRARKLEELRQNQQTIQLTQFLDRFDLHAMLSQSVALVQTWAGLSMVPHGGCYRRASLSCRIGLRRSCLRHRRAMAASRSSSASWSSAVDSHSRC